MHNRNIDVYETRSQGHPNVRVLIITSELKAWLEPSSAPSSLNLSGKYFRDLIVSVYGLGVTRRMREDVPWIVSQRLPTPAVCWQALSRHEAKPKAHRHCLCLVHEKRIPKGARDPRARPLGARGQKTSRNQGGRCPQCRSPLSLDCSPEQTALQMFRPVTIRGRAIEGQDIEARGGTSS